MHICIAHDHLAVRLRSAYFECEYFTGQNMNEVCGICLHSHPSQPQPFLPRGPETNHSSVPHVCTCRERLREREGRLVSHDFAESECA